MSNEIVATTNKELSLSTRSEIEGFIAKSTASREISEWYIACALNEMYLTQLYKTPDENGVCFSKFENWAKDMFGYAKSTASNWRNAFSNCYYYGEDKKIHLRHECFRGFTVSKVNELNSLFTSKGFDKVVKYIESNEIMAGMTVSEIRKKVKELTAEVVADSTAQEVSEDTKAEDTKAEDTKAEDTKAEDTKAEDTKEDIVARIKKALTETRMNDDCRQFVFAELEKLL